MPEDNLVKILFRFYSDILEEDTVESVLAEVVDIEMGYYKIDRIPFYVPQVAIDDIVWAEFSTKEGAVTYRKTTQSSGNSTIHVVVLDDKDDINAYTKIFEEMGCGSEKLNHRYFALNIPAGTDYLPIKRKLDALEKEEIIGYAESGLSEKHQYRDYHF
jgi:hypothetical protein